MIYTGRPDVNREDQRAFRLPAHAIHPTPLSLTAIPLRVTARVTHPVVLNEHKGSALRGALFHALRKRSCVRLELSSCHPCELVPVCPISALVATVDPEWERGTDPPRPLVVDPPLDDLTTYTAGADLEFGVTVFGSATRLLPYVVLALNDLAHDGLGRRYQVGGLWTRGQLAVRRVALADISGREIETLFAAPAGELPHSPLFHSPAQRVEWPAVLAAASWLGASGEVTLRFRTPTRLVARGELVRRFELMPFLRRLRERLAALERRYGTPESARALAESAGSEVAGPGSEANGAASGTAFPFDADDLAARLEVADNHTAWQEVRGYSTRQHQAVPLSGFTGSATLRGDVSSALPYLLWGSLAHVGKEATKGNGWYALS
ncbi:MAG: CRISPR system precrRNA processing endoribonuclease RAMP protein Cas6 [Chloroflexota bacterium]